MKSATIYPPFTLQRASSSKSHAPKNLKPTSAFITHFLHLLHIFIKQQDCYKDSPVGFFFCSSRCERVFMISVS